jgi:phospholipid/cholesterol/gamma-HCH transport system permease protein
MTAPALRLANGGATAALVAQGAWDIDHLSQLETLAHIALPNVRRLELDLDAISRLDTWGAWALASVLRRARQMGADCSLRSQNAQRVALVRRMQDSLQNQSVDGNDKGLQALLSRLGQATEKLGRDGLALLDLVGRLAVILWRGVRHPARWHVSSIIHHLDCVGLRAVPIIALMTLLIGCIIAQQGFFHFTRFGARDYVVDLVTILVLREIGVLLVIIMVAGRSGSAYTAEIGSMKMREEIDALRVMGLDPVEYLIFPRVVALVLAAPLLTLLGNFAALYGAGLVAATYGGMSPQVFLERLREAATMTHFQVGLIKAPVMALVIGSVAALEGMKVAGSAESLGRGATSSVVRSIFLVIVLDGVFAILFAAVGM